MQLGAPLRYDVFLSYSRAVDGRLAPHVQALLGSIAWVASSIG